MGFTDGVKKFLHIAAVTGTVAAGAEGAASAKTAEKTRETTPHTEVMRTPEQALFAGAKFAGDELARQEEGGGVETGPTSVFESNNGAKVWFEKSSGEAGKWGEYIATVSVVGPDGKLLERKFVLKKEEKKDPGSKPEYTVRAPLSDIEGMEALAANTDTDE